MRNFFLFAGVVGSWLTTVSLGAGFVVGMYGLMTDQIPAHCAVTVMVCGCGSASWGFLAGVATSEWRKRVAR